MPSPSSSLATLRPDLADSLMEFDLAMNMQGFVGTRIMPIFEVATAANIFGKIPIEQLLQRRETRRAPGSGYSRGKFKFTNDSYATQENGAEEPIDDREAELYINFFDAEVVATLRAYSSVLMNQEVRIASLLFNPSTYTVGNGMYADVTDWTNATSATPIDDVKNRGQAMWNKVGMYPNAMVLNRQRWRDLIRCAQVIDAIEASGAGSPAKMRDVTTQMVAATMDLDDIIIADAAINNAAENQDASLSQIWSGSYASLVRVCTSQDIKEPGFGRTFHWSADGSSPGGTVETYRDETVRSDIARVRHDTHEKVLYTECAQLMKID
jgi:hypothetical protein